MISPAKVVFSLLSPMTRTQGIRYLELVASRALEWLRRSRFGLAALLIPIAIRAVPEIIVGPYPVGWDTIAFYVPNTLDWAGGKVSSLQMLGTAPLMYIISVPLYSISHINPVWLFKAMGPVLYGSMIFALFRYLRLGLGWSPPQALGGGLFTSLYFVTLRISWDLYRNMLGLTFILFALVFLPDVRGRRSGCLLGLSIFLAVAADQLTAVVALFLVGSRALAELRKGNKTQFIDLILSATPAIVLLFSIVYTDLNVLGVGLLQPQSPLPDSDVLINSVGFLGFAYLPLIPLIALGFRRVRNLEITSWGFFCVAAALMALLPFVGLNVVSYRWTLLASIPLCVLGAAGLVRVESVRLRIGSLRWLQKLILPLFSITIVLSATLYICLPAQQALSYYTAFPGLLPTSMLQDTVPLSDMGHLKTLLNWVEANTGPQTALITHQAIYGWARAYTPSEPTVNYQYSGPLEGVQMARRLGYSSILMIWWVNGMGWHGQPTVPAGFVPVASAGNLVVYAYD
jgi:hypothetical protein